MTVDANLTTLLPAIAEIVGVNVLLSGDNAVVIALACRGLPESQRRLGVILGAGTAVALRIVFTLIITTLMGIPWLSAAGALILFWIAVNLLLPEDADKEIAGHASLWHAVRTVAVADVVMSFDNVLAITAAAEGNLFLIVLGLVISVPLVVVGATLILKLIERFPLLVWAGAALLGWIAGELLMTDEAAARLLPALPPQAVSAIAAVLVLVAGFLWRRLRGIYGLSV